MACDECQTDYDKAPKKPGEIVEIKHADCVKTLDLNSSQEINEARKRETGYGPEEQAVIELINHLIERYEISLYSLACWSEHDCDCQRD